MRRGLTAAAPPAPDALQATLDARLEARLDRTSSAPLALGLSGGGDSLALLHLAAAWCARAHRPLLALTVDHGLDARSASWTAQAGRMAAAAGVAWRGLAWTGPKPSTGLPAAARAARHARLAEAAREAGASVLMLAHTADDHAETEALRAREARAIGRLREWAPSPAWPEGCGAFLLRPLLDVRRAALRGWLSARRIDWLDDPANEDARFARARLRAAGVAFPAPVGEAPAGFGRALASGGVDLPRAALAARVAGARRSLSAAIACAAGAAAGPRGAAMEALSVRLAGTRPFTATLGGARVDAGVEAVRVTRDLGRTPPGDAALPAGVAVVWDGRFQAVSQEEGWRIGVARRRLARLPTAERALLRALPPAARGAHPVFVRGEEVRLRPEHATLAALAPARFDAAVGRIASEAELATWGGAAPRLA